MKENNPSYHPVNFIRASLVATSYGILFFILNKKGAKVEILEKTQT